MKRKSAWHAFAISALIALPLPAAALTPGMYEYTMKMNIPGAPANMPPRTFQRCLTPKDVDGNKIYESAQGPGSDCQIKDLNQSGGQFSYKISCTKPQKMDGTVQGTTAPTSMNMDMTMTMEGMSMTQNMTVKRIGDCKQ